MATNNYLNENLNKGNVEHSEYDTENKFENKIHYFVVFVG